MTTAPGTYALVLACNKTGNLRIGQLGSLVLQRGFYIYVGSAFGPGGLAARIKHHCSISPHPHWHIDYLRAKCDLIEVWFTSATGRHEHSWAKAAPKSPGSLTPMPRFGSSDCTCLTHLFWFPHPPSAHEFRRLVESPVTVCRST